MNELQWFIDLPGYVQIIAYVGVVIAIGFLIIPSKREDV